MNYFYSYWSDKNKITKDLYNPILISIATLREKTKEEIFVFDYGKTDWEGYDKKLKINILKIKNPFIKNLTLFQNNVFYRNINLFEFAKESKEKEFSLVDSDIFWLDKIKIKNEKFNVRCGEKIGFNNGCYFFKKNSLGFDFMNLFVSNLRKAIKDIEFRELIIKKYNHLNDETICRFTYENNKKLCLENNFLYNGALFDVNYISKWNDESKNIHVVHGHLKNNLKNKKLIKKCGLVGFLIEEINQSIKSQIPEYYEKIKINKTISLEKIINEGTTDLLLSFCRHCRFNMMML